MLARQNGQVDQTKTDQADTSYASGRVFDGMRSLSADQVKRLRANYKRTQITIVGRFVSRAARRLFGIGPARCG
jgi:hypothetical protein